MSSVTTQNYAILDPCQSGFEVFTDEFLAPYNASYTFCQDAANKCATSSVNVSTATVKDIRNSSITNATRPLYYFYAQSFFGDSSNNLLSCLKQGGLNNVTLFWAPGQQTRDAARVSDFPVFNAASGSLRRPSRSSSSLTQLLAFAVAFVFVLQHFVGMAHASSVPTFALQKRSFGCQKFEPQGEANQTSLHSTKLSDLHGCQGQDPCIVVASGSSIAYSGDLVYELSGTFEQPITFDAQKLISQSFNSTMIERYSEANRQRPSTGYVAIQTGLEYTEYLSATKSADLYNGAFTMCEDGNTHPGRLYIPTAEWHYNLVTTTT